MTIVLFVLLIIKLFDRDSQESITQLVFECSKSGHKIVESMQKNVCQGMGKYHIYKEMFGLDHQCYI